MISLHDPPYRKKVEALLAWIYQDPRFRAVRSVLQEVSHWDDDELGPPPGYSINLNNPQYPHGVLVFGSGTVPDDVFLFPSIEHDTQGWGVESDRPLETFRSIDMDTGDRLDVGWWPTFRLGLYNAISAFVRGRDQFFIGKMAGSVIESKDSHIAKWMTTRQPPMAELLGERLPPILNLTARTTLFDDLSNPSLKERWEWAHAIVRETDPPISKLQTRTGLIVFDRAHPDKPPSIGNRQDTIALMVLDDLDNIIRTAEAKLGSD